MLNTLLIVNFALISVVLVSRCQSCENGKFLHKEWKIKTEPYWTTVQKRCYVVLKCTKHVRKFRRVNYIESTYRCCSGYQKNPHKSDIECNPICRENCQPRGECISPGVCQCDWGKNGDTCREEDEPTTPTTTASTTTITTTSSTSTTTFAPSTTTIRSTIALLSTTSTSLGRSTDAADVLVYPIDISEVDTSLLHDFYSFASDYEDSPVIEENNITGTANSESNLNGNESEKATDSLKRDGVVKFQEEPVYKDLTKLLTSTQNKTIESSNFLSEKDLYHTKKLTYVNPTLLTSENATFLTSENVTKLIFENATLSVSEDATMSTSENATMLISENDTLSISEDAAMSASENATMLISENDTLSISEDETMSTSDNATFLTSENFTMLTSENATLLPSEDVTVSSSEISNIITSDNVTKMTNKNYTILDSKNVNMLSFDNVAIPAYENVTIIDTENPIGISRISMNLSSSGGDLFISENEKNFTAPTYNTTWLNETQFVPAHHQWDINLYSIYLPVALIVVAIVTVSGLVIMSRFLRVKKKFYVKESLNEKPQITTSYPLKGTVSESVEIDSGNVKVIYYGNLAGECNELHHFKKDQREFEEISF